MPFKLHKYWALTRILIIQKKTRKWFKYQLLLQQYKFSFKRSIWHIFSFSCNIAVITWPTDPLRGQTQEERFSTAAIGLSRPLLLIQNRKFMNMVYLPPETTEDRITEWNSIQWIPTLFQGNKVHRQFKIVFADGTPYKQEVTDDFSVKLHMSAECITAVLFYCLAVSTSKETPSLWHWDVTTSSTWLHMDPT